MIDFALEAEREEGKPPGRGDLPGLPAALPADHDDHHGGAARRAAAGAGHRHRRRAAPPAGHRHRRRPDLQPGAHALHHAGDLPGLRSPGCARAHAAAKHAIRLARPARYRRTPGARECHEHLSAVHPPAGRHHAADGGPGPAGRHRLHLPAGLAPAPGGVPHHPGLGGPAGSQSGDHGLLRGHPSGAPVRAHRRHHRDDLDQLPGRDQHHPAVRPEPQHRRGRARRPGGHQRRPRRPARRTCRTTPPTAR